LRPQIETSMIRPGPILALAGAALLLWIEYGEITRGMLSRHMLTHVALMSLIAPAVALLLMGRIRTAPQASPLLLWAATAAQIMVFVGWHAPPVLAAGSTRLPSLPVMQASLLAVAVMFWLAVLLHVPSRRWTAIAALLITGKIFCLVAALMVFAPRFLFGTEPAAMSAVAMDDQRLAGLLMLTACPLTYVVASVCIVCEWFYRSAAGASIDTASADRRG